MSSSDHVEDDTGAMAPCLRAICDNLNTSLTSEAIAKSRECGQFSYLDVLGEFVRATDFVEKGEDVVKSCVLWHRLKKDGQIRNSPGHRPTEGAVPVGTSFVEVPVLFKQSTRKALPFDAVAVDATSAGSQQIEKMKLDAVVEDILSRMDLAARERYFAGIGEVEPEEYRVGQITQGSVCL
jgi:hypothetical protein